MGKRWFRILAFCVILTTVTGSWAFETATSETLRLNLTQNRIAEVLPYNDEYFLEIANCLTSQSCSFGLPLKKEWKTDGLLRMEQAAGNKLWVIGQTYRRERLMLLDLDSGKLDITANGVNSSLSPDNKHACYLVVMGKVLYALFIDGHCVYPIVKDYSTKEIGLREENEIFDEFSSGSIKYVEPYPFAWINNSTVQVQIGENVKTTTGTVSKHYLQQVEIDSYGNCHVAFKTLLNAAEARAASRSLMKLNGIELPPTDFETDDDKL